MGAADPLDPLGPFNADYQVPTRWVGLFLGLYAREQGLWAHQLLSACSCSTDHVLVSVVFLTRRYKREA